MEQFIIAGFKSYYWQKEKYKILISIDTNVEAFGDL